MALEKEYTDIQAKVMSAERSGNLAPEWRPDAAWQRLEAQLIPAGRKKIIIAWYWKVAVLVLLFGLTFLFSRRIGLNDPKTVLNESKVKPLASGDTTKKNYPLAFTEPSEKNQLMESAGATDTEVNFINKQEANNSEEVAIRRNMKVDQKPEDKIESFQVQTWSINKKDIMPKQMALSKTPQPVPVIPVVSEANSEKVGSKSFSEERKSPNGLQIKFFTRTKTNSKANNERPPLAGFASIKK